MDVLADSGRLAGDPAALAARLAADGYVFLPGLLPAGQVSAVGEQVAAGLRAAGWSTAGSPRLPPGAGPREALADPAYRAAVTSRTFNELPYLAPLRRVIRGLLGPGAFSYPVKVLRAVPPEHGRAVTKGRYVHCDYVGSGVQDMLTSWMPLARVPVSAGGLAVRPGGHRDRPRVPRLLAGPGAPASPGRRWATADYQPGDVLIFHCLTPHAALPNTGGQLRLSADFRWQHPGWPAPAEMVLGPKARPPELFSRLLAREPWWEPVPPGLELVPRAGLAGRPPGPSRFFAVHPGWQSWRPPGGAARAGLR